MRKRILYKFSLYVTLTLAEANYRELARAVRDNACVTVVGGNATKVDDDPQLLLYGGGELALARLEG